MDHGYEHCHRWRLSGEVIVDLSQNLSTPNRVSIITNSYVSVLLRILVKYNHSNK